MFEAGLTHAKACHGWRVHKVLMDFQDNQNFITMWLEKNKKLISNKLFNKSKTPEQIKHITKIQKGAVSCINISSYLNI